ncbi:hypothetical protein [Mucilaginibacter sp.]|uniref:hypothetical protein n=1 Tax=Mucilaginibacter sp. TaxID=1882438 RepID=UPI00284B8052|nr:hypothetical protein [Mucilaginibacter sp.]MDR3696696.1 hypothetical protein [Mucilaginibacter sp.]
MNSFTELYKTLSNSDLLKIIDNAADYQPIAVETAVAELAGRKLSAEELESAVAANALEQQEKAMRKEKRQAFENKVKGISAQVIDAVHPVQQSTPSTNRIINFLSVALGIMFLLTLFTELSFLTFVFFNKDSRWDSTLLVYLLQLFIVPVLTLLFWRRKRAGWILLCIYCSYSIVSGVVLFFMVMKRFYGIPATDTLFPTMSSASFLWNVVFYGGCLWLVCKRDVRDIYQVNDRSALLIAGITAAVTLGVIWGSLSMR